MTILGESFNRGDGGAVSSQGGVDAAMNRLSIHPDRATTTVSRAADAMHALAALLPQEGQQGGAGGTGGRSPLPINVKGKRMIMVMDRLSHGLLSIPFAVKLVAHRRIREFCTLSGASGYESSSGSYNTTFSCSLGSFRATIACAMSVSLRLNGW